MFIGTVQKRRPQSKGFLQMQTSALFEKLRILLYVRVDKRRPRDANSIDFYSSSVHFSKFEFENLIFPSSLQTGRPAGNQNKKK